jgi:hypothetical protein
MKKPSMQDDLRVVKRLVEQDKLDDVMRKLDAKDIPGSLRKVPVEVVRLAMTLLSVSDVDKKIEDVDPEQQVPAKALLASARGNKIEPFIARLRKSITGDAKVRQALGLDITAIPKLQEATEAKINNTINRVLVTPQLMLKSTRVYMEVAFFRNDQVLLRTEMELDDILSLGASLLGAVQECLKLLSKNAPGVSPKIEVERCEYHLGALRKSIRKLPALLKPFRENEKKPGKKATKQPGGK